MPLTTHNFQTTSTPRLIMQANFISTESKSFIIAYNCSVFSPVFHHTECSCGRCGLLPGQVQELPLPQTLEWQVRVHRAGLLEPQESVVPHLEPRPERRRAGRHAGGLHQSVEDEAIIDSFIGKWNHNRQFYSEIKFCYKLSWFCALFVFTYTYLELYSYITFLKHSVY